MSCYKTTMFTSCCMPTLGVASLLIMSNPWTLGRRRSSTTILVRWRDRCRRSYGSLPLQTRWSGSDAAHRGREHTGLHTLTGSGRTCHMLTLLKYYVRQWCWYRWNIMFDSSHVDIVEMLCSTIISGQTCYIVEMSCSTITMRRTCLHRYNVRFNNYYCTEIESYVFINNTSINIAWNWSK